MLGIWIVVPKQQIPLARLVYFPGVHDSPCPDLSTFMGPDRTVMACLFHVVTEFYKKMVVTMKSKNGCSTGFVAKVVVILGQD